MIKRIQVLFLCAVMAAPAAVVYPTRPPVQETNAHDPSVLKDGSWYYVYATHGAPVFRSRDLIQFEQVVDKAFPLAPERAREHVGVDGKDIWAPDIVKMGDEYRLYYCLSKFGTSQSYIGFATGPSPTGPFVEAGGLVTSSQPAAEPGYPNALDPSVLSDTRGRQWLIYGSFFGGIYVVRLDPETGELYREGEIGDRIAFRQSTALEGPCAIYNPTLDEYFLFVSYDKLDSTYNVRVGRSKRPDGPYKDFNNDDMAGEEDNLPKILNSYAFENHTGWHGPGHNSVLRDGDDYYMLHHARILIGGNKHVRLHVRKMVFTDEGWPVVSPERYAGEKEQPIPASEMEGYWEWLPLDPTDNTMQTAHTGLVFEKNGVLRFEGKTGRWQVKAPNSLRFKLENNPPVSAKILPAWDWENDRPTLVFTGLDDDGTAVWGKKRGLLQ